MRLEFEWRERVGKQGRGSPHLTLYYSTDSTYSVARPAMHSLVHSTRTSTRLCSPDTLQLQIPLSFLLIYSTVRDYYFTYEAYNHRVKKTLLYSLQVKCCLLYSVLQHTALKTFISDFLASYDGLINNRSRLDYNKNNSLPTYIYDQPINSCFFCYKR